MLLRIITATGIALGLVATAQAATLAAGPILVHTGDFLSCFVVNVSSKAVEVTITSVVDDTVVGDTFEMDPGARIALNNSNVGQGGVGGYCLFDVKGSKSKVRASACVHQGNESCQASLPGL